jgi:hypothetical protein
LEVTVMRRLLSIIVCISLLVFPLAGCGGAPNGKTTGNPPEATDELFSNSQKNAELDIFKEDGLVYTVKGHYELPGLADYDKLVDGGYYKLTADITYLNGGVAGYVDYPQIDRVISIEEIPATQSPEESKNAELVVSIDGVEVDVAWEENESVQALRELAEDAPLEVQMSMYSDFEQVGSLGAELPRDDEQMTTDAAGLETGGNRLQE